MESFRPRKTVRLYGRWRERGPALVTDGETVVIGLGKRRMGPNHIGASLRGQYPALRRTPRLYLVRQLCLPVILSGASIAVVVVARLSANWLWLPVSLDYCWLIYIGVRYSGMHGLLRRLCVASQGNVLSVAPGRWRAQITAMIEVPDEPVRRWTPIGKRAQWLAEGQEVVVLRSSTSGDTAVIATSDGHAAFAVARMGKPDI